MSFTVEELCALVNVKYNSTVEAETERVSSTSEEEGLWEK